MKKKDYSVKQHKSGLQYKYVDSEIYCSDDSGWIYIDITKPGEEGIGVTVNLDMVWSHDDFEFEWEADGEPTYVDYGSQSVLYDSGEGGLESVEVHADVEDYQFLDFDDPDIDAPITKEQVLEILGCSEEDLNDLMKEVEALAVSHAEADLEEYYEDPDNWPDRPEYEPDYDDWRDVDWD
jgi:hypothetical protein